KGRAGVARRMDAPVGERERPCLHAVRVHHEGIFENTTGLRRHRASTERSDSVQTHLRHIASRCTSSPCRQAMASGEFNTASRLPAEWMLPNGGWKKHGRTVPSASITLDTHGALQSLGKKSPSPTSAAKYWPRRRRSLAGDSAM